MKVSALYLLHFLVFASGLACSDERTPVMHGTGLDDGVGPPVTRSEVIRTADEYARLHWTMSTTNRYGISCGSHFVSNYMEGPRIGVGYKWGGWNDIDDFRQKIEEGYGTGTGGGANTYENFSIDCVVGVSCTGFVSRAWHLNEKYTLCYADPDIPRKFCEITEPITEVDLGSHQTEGLKKGDMFINDYHTILFIYRTRSGHPQIMDSSHEGVRFRRLSFAQLALEGYRAVRYRNIVDDTDPPGTIANPIAIDSNSLPFVDNGNTRDVVSMNFDSYSAAPLVSQVGPDVVYELTILSPGSITITVTDIKNEGIDNDVHLLASLEKSDPGMVATDCIESADNTITRELDEGLYYLIVDSSHDLPGEYTLSVEME
ncbi:MAG: hypothetical protein JSW50_11370 [Candidatus Latescibacterota bacterium]|nr:MAG: hypothetical protein JSW50_11370 [Candidatus Latescibacterota bacterium]